MQNSSQCETTAATRHGIASLASCTDENLHSSGDSLRVKTCRTASRSVLKSICVPQIQKMDANKESSKDRLSLFEILSKNSASEAPIITPEQEKTSKINSFSSGLDISNLKKLGSGKLVQNYIKNDSSKSVLHGGKTTSTQNHSPSKSPNFKALKNVFKKVNLNDLKQRCSNDPPNAKPKKQVPILPKPISSKVNVVSLPKTTTDQERTQLTASMPSQIRKTIDTKRLTLQQSSNNKNVVIVSYATANSSNFTSNNGVMTHPSIISENRDKRNSVSPALLQKKRKLSFGEALSLNQGVDRIKPVMTVGHNPKVKKVVTIANTGCHGKIQSSSTISRESSGANHGKVSVSTASASRGNSETLTVESNNRTEIKPIENKHKTIPIAKASIAILQKNVTSNSHCNVADDINVRKSSRKRKMNSSLSGGEFMIAKGGLRNLFNVFGVEPDKPKDDHVVENSMKKHKLVKQFNEKVIVKNELKLVKGTYKKKEGVDLLHSDSKKVKSSSEVADRVKNSNHNHKSVTDNNHKLKEKHKLILKKHLKENAQKLRQNSLNKQKAVNLAKKNKVSKTLDIKVKVESAEPKEATENQEQIASEEDKLTKSDDFVGQSDKVVRSKIPAMLIKSPKKDRNKLLADIQRKRLVEKSKMISNQQLTKLQKGNLRPRLVRSDQRILAASTLKLAKKTKRYRGRQKRRRRSSESSWDSSSESDSESSTENSSAYEECDEETDNSAVDYLVPNSKHLSDIDILIMDERAGKQEESDSELSIEIDIDSSNTDDILNPLHVPFQPRVLADALNPARRDSFVVINNGTNWNDVATEMPSGDVFDSSKLDQTSVRLLRATHTKRPKLYIDNFNPEKLESSSCTCHVSFTEMDDGVIVCHLDSSGNDKGIKTRNKNLNAKVEKKLNDLDPSDHFIVIPIISEFDVRNADSCSLNMDFESYSNDGSNIGFDSNFEYENNYSIGSEPLMCNKCGNASRTLECVGCDSVNSAKKKREFFSEVTVSEDSNTISNDKQKIIDTESSSKVRTRPKRLKSHRFSADYYYYDNSSSKYGQEMPNKSNNSVESKCSSHDIAKTGGDKELNKSQENVKPSIVTQNNNNLVSSIIDKDLLICSQSSSLTDLSAFVNTIKTEDVNEFAPIFESLISDSYSISPLEQFGLSDCSDDSDVEEVVFLGENVENCINARCNESKNSRTVANPTSRSQTPIQFASGKVPFIDHTYCYPPPLPDSSSVVLNGVEKWRSSTASASVKKHNSSIASDSVEKQRFPNMAPIVKLSNIQSFLTVCRHLKRIQNKPCHTIYLPNCLRSKQVHAVSELCGFIVQDGPEFIRITRTKYSRPPTADDMDLVLNECSADSI